MTELQIKKCERCKKDFECKASGIESCQCSAVKLNNYQRDYIAKKYSVCLCAACLRQLAAEYGVNS